MRTALFGPERPRFTGNVAWRGLVPAGVLDGAGVRPVAALWMGPAAHFVHYFVRGGQLVNFVGVVEHSDWRDESWTARGDKRDLLRDFSGWHRTVQAIVAEADANACFRWALFDRDPLARWSRGAATLIGDACHPTLPFMAQGACMAIEDAAVLAEYVSTSSANALPEALARYETAAPAHLGYPARLAQEPRALPPARAAQLGTQSPRAKRGRPRRPDRATLRLRRIRRRARVSDIYVFRTLEDRSIVREERSVTGESRKITWLQ